MAFDHLKAGDDHHKKVVEVVRDPAGELANRFHLLRLAQRVFYTGAVG